MSSFTLALHLQTLLFPFVYSELLFINNAASLYKLSKWDIKYWSVSTPSDRPSYLQTDLVQLIHLLSSNVFFFFICRAKQTAFKLYYIPWIFRARKQIKVFPQISANFSESAQPQLLHVAAGESYIPFIFSSKAITLCFIASLSLANEHKATASSSLMTAKLSQMSSCVWQ